MFPRFPSPSESVEHPVETQEMNESDIGMLLAELEAQGEDCQFGDESGAPAPCPIPAGIFDELTMFLRIRNLCWGEIGNEDRYFRDLLTPFEESQFYKIRKTYWNTEVPKKHKYWEGGVLLVVPPGAGDLRERAYAQFLKYKDVVGRPLFKKTEGCFTQMLTQTQIDPMACQEFDVLESIYNDTFNFAGDVRNLYWVREIVRQFVLAKRLTYSDAVFVSRDYKKTKDVAKIKDAPLEGVVTFFQIK